MCRLPQDSKNVIQVELFSRYRASPLLHPGFLSGRLASKATIRYANEGMSARFSLRFALSSHPTSLSTFTRWATSIENVWQCTEESKSDRSKEGSKEFFLLFFSHRDLINFIRSNYQCLLSQLLIETMFSFFLYLETTIIIKRKDENIVSGEIFINTLHDSRVLRSAFRKFRSSCFFLSKLTTMSSVSDTSNPWPRFLVTIHSLFTPRYL